MSIDGQDIEARLRRSKFHRQQQNLDVSNRFFWLSRNGVIHVCTCRRSKQEREKALQRAKHLLSTLVAPLHGN